MYFATNRTNFISIVSEKKETNILRVLQADGSDEGMNTFNGNICMCACMCICVYVHVCVCVYVCMYLYICVCVYACVHISARTPQSFSCNLLDCSMSEWIQESI